MSLSLKLCKFLSFKQKQILTDTFFRSEFKVTKLSQFQSKANSYEDICWVSFWSYVGLWVWNKANSYINVCWASVWSYVSLWISHQCEFLRRHLLGLSLKLSRFTTFKQNRILIKTYIESQFEVMQLYVFQTKADSYEDISSA